MRGVGLTLALLLAAIAPAAARHSDPITVETIAVAEPSANAEPSDVEQIAGDNDGHDRMTVPVRLGGRGPFRFLIDTGSQRSALSTELAAQLALTPGEKRRVIGIAGAELADTAILGELALGKRSFHGLDVLLFEARHIGADGIVGLDSLQKQRVLIDFARNSMQVGNARTLGGSSGFEIVVTARRRAGQLIMTQAEIDGVRTAVIIDTGASISVGNRALEHALGQRAHVTQFVLESVTGLSVTADIGYARKLNIGDIGITNPLIAYVDGPAFAALGLDKKPALMLGMRELRLFRRVAIDFAARKVFFDLPDDFETNP